MIEYRCQDETLMGKAHHQLINQGHRHHLIGLLSIGFRKKPCRKAKIILSQCGFERTA